MRVNPKIVLWIISLQTIRVLSLSDPLLGAVNAKIVTDNKNVTGSDSEIKSRRARISVIKPYRVQRRLSPPDEVEFELKEFGKESDEQERSSSKSKRRVIYRIAPKKKIGDKKGSTTTVVSLSKPTAGMTKLGLSLGGSNHKKTTTTLRDPLGMLSSFELNEIFSRKGQGHWGLPYPEDKDKDKESDKDEHEHHGHEHGHGYGHGHGHGHGHDPDPDHEHNNHHYHPQNNKFNYETPSYIIDPSHPAIQAQTNHNPLAPYHPINHYPGLPPAPAVPNKKKKKTSSVTPENLLPLDKTLLTLGIAFGWIFWVGAFVAYYYYAEKSDKSVNLSWFGNLEHNDLQQKLDSSIQSYPQKPIIVKIEPGKAPQFFQTARSGGESSFSFLRILDMISIAQETYDKFDFKNLDCQKKAFCELEQKQGDFGEAGKKISSYFSIMSALEGLSILPSFIQEYLKEFKGAVSQGKDTTKDCASLYPGCDYSIPEAFKKYYEKTEN